MGQFPLLESGLGDAVLSRTHGVQRLLSKTSGEKYSFSFINHSLGSGEIKTTKNVFHLLVFLQFVL